ncbi:sensor histidine kinase [Streptococcus thoraltensis]|uniref:sensor histidine kinase n=1 Tax=Streptococcus thoraltensis TaxID=55085 RepID=UPI000364C4D3|nr:GHKL domain-containing protein [Streptococcus thoraltensis]MDY4760525.1 GHKL domain-containing protein [Streptococcus thoraltensis]
MTDLVQFLVQFIDTLCFVFLFAFTQDKKITLWQCLLIALGKYIIFSLLFLFLPNFFFELVTPFYFLSVSFLLNRKLEGCLQIFRGLFPITLHHIIYLGLVYFIIPLAKMGYEDVNRSVIISISLSISSTIISYCFLKYFNYYFKTEYFAKLNAQERRFLIIINVSMILYYILIKYVVQSVGIDTDLYKASIVFIYIVFFLTMINRLDKSMQIELKEELMFQKDIQLQNLKEYSKQIEDLYIDIKRFRHDYLNILKTLAIGIEEKNFTVIESIYQETIKDTDKPFKNTKYDIGRLINVKNESLKSLLAVKLTQARENGVVTSIEIPTTIDVEDIEMIDCVTIISILLDNAMEAALKSEKKILKLAFFETISQQIILVENTIKEERIEVKQLFELGFSSNGYGRGIGLANVSSIIGKYSHIVLETKSQNYYFTQTIKIKKRVKRAM